MAISSYHNNIEDIKVLIISHNALSLHANNGKTLHSLFKDFGGDKVAQLFFQDETPESDKFKLFFRIRDVDILKSAIGIQRKKDCGNIVIPEAYLGKFQVNKSRMREIVKKIFRHHIYLLVLLRDLLYATNVWKSDKSINWISEFSPNAIFYLGGNALFSFHVVMWLAGRFKIPYYIYLTDDYVINNSPPNLIQKWQKNALINCYKRAFESAAGMFVIGEMMAQEFGEYFKKKFHPIMNSIEFSSTPKPVFKNNTKNNDQTTIVYAGGLHLNRWKMIVEFGHLMKQCCDRLHKNVLLEIFSIQEPDATIRTKLNELPLSYKGSLSGDELKAKLANADFLLHVESFERKYRQLTKLSVSTKISEYLASGTCIIGYGPADVASIRILSDNKIGLTITDIESDNEKIEKLCEALSNVTLRNEFAQRGYEYAFNNFNAEKSRAYLKQILCSPRSISKESSILR